MMVQNDEECGGASRLERMEESVRSAVWQKCFTKNKRKGVEDDGETSHVVWPRDSNPEEKKGAELKILKSFLEMT